MSFVVTAPTTPELEPAIENGPFWPAIDPAKVRASLYIDGTVNVTRLQDVLLEAMASVNGELDAWRLIQEAAGYATLADVPSKDIGAETVILMRYRRAVGCFAKAMLIERYRDYDTTAAGNKKADQLESPIDDLRRDARWAISDILNIGRTTVELI